MGRPSPARAAALTLVGQRMFDGTQERVHVLTESLKNSGKYTVRWEGRAFIVRITYGGSSSGVNNPVNYAIYEMARGGDHDFLADVTEYYDEFEQAMAIRGIL